MSSRKVGLGRGLEALLNAQSSAKEEPKVMTEPGSGNRLEQLPIEMLAPGRYQPRQQMNEASLRELSDSIRIQGIIQPIVVRQINQGRYEIIAGERRWRAAQMAGLINVPVIVREAPDQAALALALIENIQREDLNPMDEARALQRLSEEFALTHEQVAEIVGKTRPTVTNLLRLTKLNKDVASMLERGALEMGHARTLLILDDRQQLEAARIVASKHLSVRETERLVHSMTNKPAKKNSTTPNLDPNIKRFQEHISEKLAAKVNIQHQANGKGKLVIHYTSVDELDGIVKNLVQEPWTDGA